MTRRIHVQQLRPGEPIPLEAPEAHHARDVLRLADGAAVEAFDDGGAVGQGVLIVQGTQAFVRVERADLRQQAGSSVRLVIAAAVPKGDRADWMVEKLSEVGAAEFVPLAAARSVVLPEGKGKRDRWLRIATEAAKQSRRAGVMRITELTKLDDAIRRATDPGGGARVAWLLSTEADPPVPIARAARDLRHAGTTLTAFIGPEGGWTESERQQFAAAGVIPVGLTPTVLRVETAAVVTAAFVACAALSAGADPLDGRRAGEDDRASNDSPATGTPL